MHYNVLSGLIIISFLSKRVNGNIICCALDRKKTCSCANFKSSTATVIELRFFMKKKMKRI